MKDFIEAVKIIMFAFVLINVIVGTIAFWHLVVFK